MKAGFVSLVGRPNAGKSTLLNRFAGQKLAIVSDKPQTTRHRILGVRNSPAGQIVFIDTPGIHKPMHRMNRRMVDAATETLREVDVVVLVVDATLPPGGGDEFVRRSRSRRSNVADRAGAQQGRPAAQAGAAAAHRRGTSQATDFKAIVPISALTGDGVDTLEQEILAALPEGERALPGRLPHRSDRAHARRRARAREGARAHARRAAVHDRPW